MSDFWVSSGHHLVDRDDAGRLVVTDEFLRAYLARPEIIPPEDACLVERAVHQRLLRGPRDKIEASEIASMKDRDAAENWRHLIAFRNHLLAKPSLEAAYLSLVRAPKVTTPPLFLNHLVQLILRNVLDGETDPYVLRAAELFFRAQRLTVKDGVMMLADEEAVDGSNITEHNSPLIAVFGDANARSLDVLSKDNADGYAGRSDAFDMVMDFRHGERGRAGLAKVMQRWISALIGVAVTIQPVERFEAQSWGWFVGLDQDGTRIGNALWQGETPPDNGLERIVALFDLRFVDGREMLDKVAGKSVPLILGMSSNRIVRLKPQNLLVGLPLKSDAHSNSGARA